MLDFLTYVTTETVKQSTLHWNCVQNLGSGCFCCVQVEKG